MGESRLFLGFTNLPKILSDAFSTWTSSSLKSNTWNLSAEDAGAGAAAAEDDDDDLVGRVMMERVRVRECERDTRLDIPEREYLGSCTLSSLLFICERKRQDGVVKTEEWSLQKKKRDWRVKRERRRWNEGGGVRYSQTSLDFELCTLLDQWSGSFLYSSFFCFFNKLSILFKTQLDWI